MAYWFVIWYLLFLPCDILPFVVSIETFTSLESDGRSLTTIVNTESELKSATFSGSVIEFASNIYLTSDYNVTGVASLVLNGNGFAIDGQHLFHVTITFSEKVDMYDLTIRNGMTSDVRSFRLYHIVNFPLYHLL